MLSAGPCAWPFHNTNHLHYHCVFTYLLASATEPQGLRSYGSGISSLSPVRQLQQFVFFKGYKNIFYRTCHQCDLAAVPSRAGVYQSTLLNLSRPYECFDQKNRAELMLCHFRTELSYGPAASTSCFLECSFLGHVLQEPIYHALSSPSHMEMPLKSTDSHMWVILGIQSNWALWWPHERHQARSTQPRQHTEPQKIRINLRSNLLCFGVVC